MSRLALLLLLLLGACSRGPEADLPSIGKARSVAAEWALVNEQASHGRLSRHYAETMRQACRDELRTVAKSLSQPGSRYGEEIRALLREPDDASPFSLRTHAGRLKQIEDSLESA